MKDATGREVQQGDIIVHISGHGSSPYLEEGTVLLVEDNRINVQKQSSRLQAYTPRRPSWISNERKIAIIGKV